MTTALERWKTYRTRKKRLAWWDDLRLASKRAYEARPEVRAAKRAYDKAYNALPQRKAYKRAYDKVYRLLRKQRKAEAALLPKGPCHWVAVIDGVTYKSGEPTNG